MSAFPHFIRLVPHTTCRNQVAGLPPSPVRRRGENKKLDVGLGVHNEWLVHECVPSILFLDKTNVKHASVSLYSSGVWSIFDEYVAHPPDGLMSQNP